LEHFRVKSRQKRRSFSVPFSRAIIFFLACAGLNHAGAVAQSLSDSTGIIRGVVINSVTREPIDRALVSSPDRRFATLTDSEGRFEFTYASGDTTGDDTRPNSAGTDRPYALIPSKPGFLPDPNQLGMNNIQEGAPKDLMLVLVPQAVIAGNVSLPTSEAPDSITLQIYRKQIQDGRSNWFPVGVSRSMSDGQFRFAGLPAGSYKLLTTELLDTDPLTTDPLTADPRGADAGDPFDSNGRGRLFGYPPVYYQGATDFASANTIELAAGQTQTANITLVKQPYYRVKIPVIVPEAMPSAEQARRGFGVNVYPGRKGPGFSLGYNPRHQAIEGMLPSGTYTVEATSFQPNGAPLTGTQTFAIKGGPVNGPSVVLVPGASIAVNVKEEFTGEDHTPGMSISLGGRTSLVKGPRRYLNLTLEPVDNFGMGRQIPLRDPTRSVDEAMVLEGVPPGTYWVRTYPLVAIRPPFIRALLTCCINPWRSDWEARLLPSRSLCGMIRRRSAAQLRASCRVHRRLPAAGLARMVVSFHPAGMSSVFRSLTVRVSSPILRCKRTEVSSPRDWLLDHIGSWPSTGRRRSSTAIPRR
jgi:hypothetical protein